MKPIKLVHLAALVLFLSCNSPKTDAEILEDVAVNIHDIAPDITVDVKNGVVFLSGMVKDSASWKKTLETTEATPGVKKIEDKLHIRLPKPAN